MTPYEEDKELADKYCQEFLAQNPDVKEMFDMVTQQLDGLFEANKEAMARIGEALVKACIRNVTTRSWEPYKIFKEAVEHAAQLVEDFKTVQHDKSRDQLLRLMEQKEAGDSPDADDAEE